MNVENGVSNTGASFLFYKKWNVFKKMLKRGLTKCLVINIMLVTDAGKHLKNKYFVINKILKRKGEIMKKQLEELRSLLIIVDMVNGFVKEGALADPNIQKIIPRQLELLKQYLNKDSAVVFIKDTHEKESSEFKNFPPHCIKGTEEAELVDDLLPYESQAISIEKNSTSFMEAPAFREFIEKTNHLKEISIVGCCTDICIANGTIALSNYLDQQNRNVDIIVHQDATATYDEEHRQAYIDAAYLLMEQKGIQLVKNFRK